MGATTSKLAGHGWLVQQFRESADVQDILALEGLERIVDDWIIAFHSSLLLSQAARRHD